MVGEVRGDVSPLDLDHLRDIAETKEAVDRDDGAFCPTANTRPVSRADAKYAFPATPNRFLTVFVAPRMILAHGAFALGYGATGLTFYDEAVSQHFATRTACMLATSVGVPDYRNASGGPPGSPVQLVRFDQLMQRLNIQPHRRWHLTQSPGAPHEQAPR